MVDQCKGCIHNRLKDDVDAEGNMIKIDNDDCWKASRFTDKEWAQYDSGNCPYHKAQVQEEC